MVKIISDSTCDLSEDLLKKYDIDILPLHILLGEKEYKDGKDITAEEIYEWSDEHKTTPKTSAPSLEDAVELIRPYVESKREVVCFSISSSMSTSGNVMRLAAEELEASELVTVIDSASLSTGIGLLVIEAAEMAQKGKNAEEISAEIEQLKPRVRASFVVDTLTYLYRGGRCNAVAAMAPEDCCRRWSNECFKKISWENANSYFFLCQRYGGRIKKGASESCIYHTFRVCIRYS